jgi:hypothetical protein
MVVYYVLQLVTVIILFTSFYLHFALHLLRDNHSDSKLILKRSNINNKKAMSENLLDEPRSMGENSSSAHIKYDNSPQVLNGDLLYADADIIVQQCNCVTKYPHGLSADIKKVLNVDPYIHRRLLKGKRNCAILEDRGKPGTTVLYDRGEGYNPRFVACVMGQYWPGKSSALDNNASRISALDNNALKSSALDNKQNRLTWFKQGLLDLSNVLSTVQERLPEPKGRKIKVAFPFLIGCGLAGGNWPDYLQAIREWTKLVEDSCEVSILQKN